MTRALSVILAAALLLGPLATIEVGLRWLVAAGRLPPAPSSNDLTDVSLANASREEGVDILLIGASAVRDGIKPGAIERLVKETTDADVRVRNLAQAGINFASQAMLARAFAKDGLLPAVVVIGLTPHMLTGESAATDDWLRGSEMGRLLGGCGEPLDLMDLETYDCLLAERSATWRWRGRVEPVLEAVDHGIPRSVEQNRSTLTPSGWLSGDPASARGLARQTPRYLRQMDESVVLSDEVAAIFGAFVAELRERGSEVIVVGMPYATAFDEALVERNPAWPEELRAGYESLALAAGIELVDIDGFEERAQPDWYRDPRHLSRVGAARFTRALWADPAFQQPILASLGLAD